MIWIRNLLVKHVDITVRKANISDCHIKELEQKMVEMYGSVVVNWCNTQRYRDLLGPEYQPTHCIEKLLNELLTDKDQKPISIDQFNKIKYTASEAKSCCASLFASYYEDKYTDPASGVQDIDEHNSEFIAEFNIYYKATLNKKGNAAEKVTQGTPSLTHY